MNEILKGIFGNLNSGIEEVDNVKTIDLTSKEGHDAAIEALNNGLNNPLINLFLGDELINSLIKKVDEIYENSNQDGEEDEIEIVQPSTLLNKKERENIDALVNEYVDTIIQPLGKFEDKIISDIKGSLTEFASWILKR